MYPLAYHHSDPQALSNVSSQSPVPSVRVASSLPTMLRVVEPWEIQNAVHLARMNPVKPALSLFLIAVSNRNPH